MEEEWCGSVLKAGCVWVTHTLGKGPRSSGGKEHNKSGASEHGYAALCAGCEGSERNGMRPLRSPCCTL